ncbi:MAG: DUF3151 domain-containing protein [Acidimicrobiia bacterium]|nr:DUF3151 domain-containing protein [Acidimicrobiia bacterium]
MAVSDIDLGTGGPPETVLPEVAAGVRSQLEEALRIGDLDQRRDAVSSVVADYPRYLDGWARLGELGRHRIERYAAFRVGYHRGLDTLRQNGWRGSGYVRWRHPSNQGFLRALHGLHLAAVEIGESEEAERTAVFLRQLDPSWPPSELD